MAVPSTSLTPTSGLVRPAGPETAVDLRPLSTSELIDRGFALYRAHFAGLLLLALLCQSAPLVSQVVATATKLNPTNSEFLVSPTSFFVKSGAMLVIGLIAQGIVFCFEVVLTSYISDAYLGRIPSVRESLRKFTGMAGATIWTCVLNRILIVLTLIFPAVAFTAIYFYLLFYPPLTLVPIMVFGFMSLVIFVASLAPVLIVFMRLMITVPSLALEKLSGWQAIRRSSDLVRYDPGLGFFNWGEMRLSFLLLPLFVIEILILFLTSLPMTLHQASEIMRHGSPEQIAAPPDSAIIISQILTFMAGSLILPLYPVATTLFYYDIRIRREGFDLEWMAARLQEKP